MRKPITPLVARPRGGTVVSGDPAAARPQAGPSPACGAASAVSSASPATAGNRTPDGAAVSLATRRVNVCGVAFDNVDMDEAVERVGELIARRRPAIVVTPNVDHVVRTSRDPGYAALVDQADLVVADGQPIVWVSVLAGRPLKERVAGSDLFPRLCAKAAERGWRVFLLGGDPGAADAARDVLVTRHPGLEIVGTYCPPMGFERDAGEDARAVAAVRAARPDLVFVGLGSPKQERWILAHMHAYGPAVSVGVGISFSFVAGHVRRAPRWMQRAGLEWFHRLCMEPRRLWKRYLVQSWRFLPTVVRGGRPDRGHCGEEFSKSRSTR